jgi:predicted nucleic acid-binding protein
MEILAGARSDFERTRLRRLLLALPVLPLRGLRDFEEAASIYRTCRAAGETMRTLAACLIAVPAMRAGAEILHNDADFDVIARHTALKIRRLS